MKTVTVGRTYTLSVSWRHELGTIHAGTRVVVLQATKHRAEITVADPSSPFHDKARGWADLDQLERPARVADR